MKRENTARGRHSGRVQSRPYLGRSAGEGKARGEPGVAARRPKVQKGQVAKMVYYTGRGSPVSWAGRQGVPTIPMQQVGTEGGRENLAGTSTLLSRQLSHLSQV